MADISIPEGDNPVRYQASLGGNQKYRNMGNVSGQAYLVRGQVTNVYYQKGTLDFNTYGSSVTSGVTDGSGSAPIPVDFWGKNTDGKVFGCYRPVQKGSQILVAYIGGDTSRPIVIGVYPDNESSYELISPVHYNTGDDSTDDVQNDALGERKIYPNQQMMYESGKGDILRSMGGKSFLYISENGSGYLDDINYAYDEISDFYDADANEIEPTMTKAQSWLLVHEDNDSDEASDGHRTRFYVNRSGELMVTFANKDDPNNIVVLEASKDSGFKLTKRFDNSNIKEDSEDYVQFGIGNGNNVSIKSVDSGDATSFYLDNGNIKFSTPNKGSITFDGISVNDLLGKVSDVESTVSDVADKVDNAARAGARAQSAASDAASQALAASMAGEDAKSAAVEAQAAGEDAKSQANDTRDRIIYYSSISDEKDVAIPGKYIIVNTDTYIRDGTIKTAHIGDGAITNAKIAKLAVGNAQIEDAAITRAKIGNLAVGTAQIEDAAITDAKIGSLSADKIMAGQIDFYKIDGVHINASNITAGTLDTNRLNVNQLSALSADLGNVTAGNLKGVNIIANTFRTPNGSFRTDENGNITANNITLTGGIITETNVNRDIANLNDPNLMNVIEKQNNITQFSGLTSQYNVIIQNAKDDGIDTTALTVAYNNLNQFMADILADPDHASDVDRVTYKKYQDAYNEELAKIQSAFQSNADNKFASAASATSQAASTANVAKSVADSAYAYADSAIAVQSTATVKAQSAADNAFNKAQEAGSQASSEIAAQSEVTAKAQSTADSAFSQAKTAIDTGNATSQAVTALKDGSTLTIAQLGNGLAEKVANSDYASYKEQTASQIAQMVTDGAFSAYQQTTADLISSKVATKDFNTYVSQTADAISSKVESKDFNTYKTQTADLINDKVSNSAYASDKTQTASQISQMVSNSAFSAYQTQTASQIASKVDNGAFSTYKTQTADLISSKVATKDFNTYVSQTADAISSKVESKDFNTYKTQTADMISSKVESKDFQALQTQVDNSTVGTNLLENTADNGVGLVSIQGDNSIPSYSAPMTRNSSYIEMTNATGSELYYRFCNPDSSMHNLKPGQTYTIQGEVYVSKGAVRFRSQNKVNGGWTDYSGCVSGSLATNTSGFVHVNYTFTVPSNATALYISWQVYDFDSTTVFRFRRTKLEVGSNATDYSTNPLDNATQSQITQLSNDINLRVTKGDLISEINLQAGNTLISASKQLTLSSETIYFDTDNPVIIPSANIGSLLVNKQLEAADITANTFSTNNKTFTVDKDGAINAKNMTLIGGKLTAADIAANTFSTNNGTFNVDKDGAITAKNITLNGSTINGGNITDTNLNIDVSDATSEASVAKSTANAAKSAADSAYDYANSEMAVQSAATDKAQSTADSAFSQAKTAIDTGNATSQAVTALKDGSTLTIAQLGNGLAEKVANSDYASYKEQTASQIAQMVTDGAFSAYQQTTKDLISSKVANSDFASYKDETASAISSKVASSAFDSYKQETADAILSKVSKKDANNINLISYSAMPNSDSTKWYGLGGGNEFKVVKHGFYHNGADPLYELDTAGSNEVFAISPRFKINANSTYTFQMKGYASANVGSMDVFVLGRRNGDTKDYTVVNQIIAGIKLSNSGLDYRTVTFTTGAIDEAYIRIDNNGSTDGNMSILGFTELKLEPGDTATPYVYGSEDSMIAQMSDDILLRVTKGDLISEINLQAGNTLISASKQLTLSSETIYFDTDNPVIIPSANITGTLNGKTINAGTINTNANNTARFYPFTADSSGIISSYYVDDHFASYARMYSGNIVISDRNMDANSGSNKYGGETAVIGGSSISLSAGYTVGKDTDFTKPLVAEGEPGTTQLVLSGITGITLKGDDQKIHFHGMYGDKQPKGITFTPYGNINADEGSTVGNWYVGYNLANMTAQFGVDNFSKNTINLYRPTFVDEIGAMGNRLDNGRLLLHAVDGDAQMYLLNDGQPGFVSPTIYNRTYPNGANVFVTSYGRIGRSTSASKYKLDITKETSISPANKLLSIDRSSWVDKNSAELLADSKTNGTELSEPEINVNRHYGLIAEDLIKAGLEEFVIKGATGQAEGIEYDRLWTVLIPKIRELSNQQIDDRMTISRMEKEIEELKQGR